MKILKTNAFWQILAILLLLVATTHVPAQTKSAANDKPQPILFARVEGEREILPFVESKSIETHPRIVSIEPSAAPVLKIAKETKNAIPVFSVTPTPLEQEAFDLINAERAKMNLPPLVLDAAMLYIARQHSESMAQSNFFNHRGLDGARVDERARQIGVSDWQGIGENIAANQEKNPVVVAVECWLKSPGHRSNLLGKMWSRSGIGIAVAENGKYYLTQVFRD
jgi:uncharacterized protein YkwD